MDNAKMLLFISKRDQEQLDDLIRTCLSNGWNMACELNRQQVVMHLASEIIRNATLALLGFKDSQEIINIAHKELLKLARLEGFEGCEICSIESLVAKYTPQLYFRTSPGKQ